MTTYSVACSVFPLLLCLLLLRIACLDAKGRAIRGASGATVENNKGDLMDQLKGLYFFAMSNGSYSDYGVDGFYVCDHLVTEDEWKQFCREERAIRDAKKRELCREIVSYAHPRKYEFEQRAYRDWLALRRSYEDMFVMKPGMVEVKYEELHLDY